MTNNHMDEPIKTQQVGNLTVEVHYDPEPDVQNPRDNDNLGTFSFFHRRYRGGDEDGCKTIEEMEQWIKDNPKGICIPVYMYDHSGVAFSTNPFGDPWDSGQVGYIHITREKILAEYGGKAITKKLRERVTKYLVEEIETLNQWSQGQVYGYIVKDEHDEELESCWGFLGGSDEYPDGADYCMSEGVAVAEELAKVLPAQRAKELEEAQKAASV